MKSKQISKLMAAGALLQQYTGNARLEWQTAHVFLSVCMSSGEATQQELEKQTGLAQSSLSRNVARLGNGETMDDPGPKLLESYEDPAYRRRKLVRLTARGRKLADELSTILEK